MSQSVPGGYKYTRVVFKMHSECFEQDQDVTQVENDCEGIHLQCGGDEDY